jgi:hypothetical protein
MVFHFGALLFSCLLLLDTCWPLYVTLLRATSPLCTRVGQPCSVSHLDAFLSVFWRAAAWHRQRFLARMALSSEGAGALKDIGLPNSVGLQLRLGIQF